MQSIFTVGRFFFWPRVKERKQKIAQLYIVKMLYCKNIHSFKFLVNNKKSLKYKIENQYLFKS